MPKGSASIIYSALQQVQISCGTEGNKGLESLLAHLVQHHRMWWVVLPTQEGPEKSITMKLYFVSGQSRL